MEQDLSSLPFNVKIGLFRTMAINAGYKASDVDAVIKTLQEQQTQTDIEAAGRGGLLELGDIAKTQPGIAVKLQKEGIKPGIKEDEKVISARTNANRVLSQLEDIFFGVGQREKERSIVPNLPNELEPLNRILGVGRYATTKVGLNPRLKTYLSTKRAIMPTLARAAGDVGALSEPEQLRAVEQLPGAFATFEEAIQGFAEARRRFGLEPRNVLNEVK